MIFVLLSMIGCSQGDSWFFRTDGVDLPVRVEGNLDSEVVLLMLHGGPKGSSFDYNYGLYTELLEDTYAMAYFDQRGQGASHGSFEAEEVTIQQLADDTANLVRAIRARYGEETSVWLFGHSWGGMLGTATILDTDVAVDGWIEAAGSHDYPLNDEYTVDLLTTIGNEEIEAGSEYASEWGTLLEEVDELNRQGGIVWEETADLNRLAYDAETYLDLPYHEDAFGEESVLGLLLGAPINFFTATVSGLVPAYMLNQEAFETSYTDRLDEITIPSLFLYGEYDFVCPPQLGVDAYERVGTDATDFILYEDAGHSLMLQAPREFASDIIDFVDTWR